jgi:Family of unknown function (DUF5691)
MNDLETIIATALIGTERQALPSITLVPNPNGESRETALLNAVTLVSAHHKAARVSRAAPARLEACGADQKPELTMVMREVLERILNGRQELLSEFLTLSKSYRFAHRDLPKMLEVGRGNTQLRSALLPLLDARGRWLANLNKDWQWAVGNVETLEDVVKTFETSSKAARTLALQSLRETDANAARALLETTWKQDPAAERKDFIAVLQTNLSNDDETFLEAALSDRSGDVRDAAASLLSQIPSSAFNARMIERLKPILAIKKGKLEFNLPEEFNPEWAKDGLEKKPPQGTGEKQWWVIQMLRRASLELLEQASGMDALTLLKSTHKDWKHLIENAIREALGNKPRPELVKGLIAYDFSYARIEGALSSLEPSLIETLTRQRCFTEQNFDTTLLESCEFDWSPAFLTDTLEWIGQQALKIKASNITQYFYSFAQIMTERAPIQQIEHIIKGQPHTPNWNALLTVLDEPIDDKKKNKWYWEYTQRSIKTLLETLQLRFEMHETFKS